MPTFLHLLLAVMTAAPGNPLPLAASDRPVYLAVEQNAAGVQLRVVGHSATACQAAYRLDVNGGANGGNRSSQSGTARLQPGAPVNLITLQLGGSAKDQWSARLSVTNCNGADYEEVKHSG